MQILIRKKPSQLTGAFAGSVDVTKLVRSLDQLGPTWKKADMNLNFFESVLTISGARKDEHKLAETRGSCERL